MGRSELYAGAHKDAMTDASFFSCNFSVHTGQVKTLEKHKKQYQSNIRRAMKTSYCDLHLDCKPDLININ